MKHRFCRKSVCGGAPESLCVEGGLISAITLVSKNTRGYEKLVLQCDWYNNIDFKKALCYNYIAVR